MDALHAHRKRLARDAPGLPESSAFERIRR
jgi:hypothetical protein